MRSRLHSVTLEPTLLPGRRMPPTGVALAGRQTTTGPPAVAAESKTACGGRGEASTRSGGSRHVQTMTQMSRRRPTRTARGHAAEKFLANFVTGQDAMSRCQNIRELRLVTVAMTAGRPCGASAIVNGSGCLAMVIAPNVSDLARRPQHQTASCSATTSQTIAPERKASRRLWEYLSWHAILPSHCTQFTTVLSAR